MNELLLINYLNILYATGIIDKKKDLPTNKNSHKENNKTHKRKTKQHFKNV